MFSTTARNNAPWSLAVSTERYRYIEYADSSKPAELYDIQSDPKEWTNLAANASHADALVRTKKLAAEHWRLFWK